MMRLSRYPFLSLLLRLLTMILSLLLNGKSCSHTFSMKAKVLAFQVVRNLHHHNNHYTTSNECARRALRFQQQSKLFSSDMDSSTSNISSRIVNNKVVQQQVPLLFIGGDYAGHKATFDCETGRLIRVPEHLVPSSMIEWGQIPSSLEVITSEDIITNTVTNDHDHELCRCIVSVLPEVGCGVDNLDTMKRLEKIPLWVQKSDHGSRYQQFYHSFASGDVSSLISYSTPVLNVYANTSTITTRMETIFALPPDTDHDINHISNDINNNNSNKNLNKVSILPRRIRVVIDLNTSTSANTTQNIIPSLSSSSQPVQSIQIKNPITIIQERQTSTNSSKGTIADGGGLDGRTVTKLIGKQYVNHPFSDTPSSITNDDALLFTQVFDFRNDCGTLLIPLDEVFQAKVQDNSMNDSVDNVYGDTSDDVKYHNLKLIKDQQGTTEIKIQSFALPGNIFIRYALPDFNNNNNNNEDTMESRRWMIQVSHVTPNHEHRELDNNDINSEMKLLTNCTNTSMKARTVSRVFDRNGLHSTFCWNRVFSME